MNEALIIDKNLKSWIKYNKDSHFPIQNIPLGIYTININHVKKICTRIGDTIIDLNQLSKLNFFGDLNKNEDFNNAMQNEKCNALIALGKNTLRNLRKKIVEIFDQNNTSIDHELIKKCLFKIEDVQLHLPTHIPNYTDFYSSREHATNVGTMFRDPANALLPNWLHLPVGYHGRASSIIVSGTDIRRPSGQIRPNDAEPPFFSKTKQLDFELEMAFVIGKENTLGTPIATQDAEDYIHGMMLFNDWSARDIQKWEYVPLGPFLAKNFASTLAPWIIDLDALTPFKINGPEQNPKPIEYLQLEGKNNYDISLEVYINDTKVCNSNTKYLYWNIAQQLAHHTVNGCNMQIGDLCASGTISGPDPSSYGSMLELAWKGTKPITLSDGRVRKFIEDGDTVTMCAYASNEDYTIGFGEAKATIIA